MLAPRHPLFPVAPLLLGFLLGAGCAARGAAPQPPANDRVRTAAFVQEGVAAYYATAFHGRRTASGSIYDETDLTAAHRTLPFGTRVRVTHLANGKEVMVTINDRGPFTKGRVIDLSREAARRLHLIQDGIARVRLEAK